MEAPQELHHHQLQISGKTEGIQSTNGEPPPNTEPRQQPRGKQVTHWLRITVYTAMVLAGQTTGTMLGKLYYQKGGNSKWMATLVQSAGFPLLFPLLLLFPSTRAAVSPSAPKLGLLYFSLGILLTGDNMMYSYGELYVAVSTYSLLCATQLAFNAAFAFFLNSLKFTSLILNSLVLLTLSAALLAFNSSSDAGPAASTAASGGRFAAGFLCTVGASAAYALCLCLVQLSFEKVIKAETFSAVLQMQIYPSFVSSCSCVVGLFASREWRTLSGEMAQAGKVPYVMTLVCIAVAWQVASIGLLGLIFEASSLFSNVISTLGLPLVPVLAVVFFHDTMNGVKAISLILAIWGFLSYIYQHYLDGAEEKLRQDGSYDRSDGLMNHVTHEVPLRSLAPTEIC